MLDLRFLFCILPLVSQNVFCEGPAESKSLKQYETTAYTDTQIRKIKLDFTII